MELDINTIGLFFAHKHRLKSSADLTRESNFFLRAFWHFGKDLKLLSPLLFGSPLWDSEQGLSVKI